MFGRKFTRYLEKRDEEVRLRDEERTAEARKRHEEGRARWAEIQRLREKAETREEETREFNREILLRNEKVYKSAIAEMEEGRRQIRANTQAVLSMLDRFNGSAS